MKAEKIKENILYSNKDYAFILSDEKFHRYATLIVKPIHITIVDNQTGLSEADLKIKIIEDWFAEENDSVRESNNKKRRKQ